jgi:hypothetical protein
MKKEVNNLGRFFSSLLHLDWLRQPPTFCSVGTGEYSGGSVKLTAHLHPVLSLKMRGRLTRFHFYSEIA